MYLAKQFANWGYFPTNVSTGTNLLHDILHERLVYVINPLSRQLRFIILTAQVLSSLKTAALWRPDITALRECRLFISSSFCEINNAKAVDGKN